MSFVRGLRSTIINLKNSAWFVATLGHSVDHEGQFRFGVWRNWNRTAAVKPKHFYLPQTEAEICRIVAAAKKIRVVGGGHSFNTSALSDDTLISLDKYNKVLAIDRRNKRVRVQAGIRLRDLQERLAALSMAIPAAGSTDAQSLGGLCATDVHGTGRDYAFLSEQIVSLRIVDGRGVARTVGPADDVYHAALGGLGCVGIVTELEIQCVPHYHLAKSIEIDSIEESEKNIEKLLATNDHMSFYYLGGVHTSRCRRNMWNVTMRPLSRFRRARVMLMEIIDFFFSGFLLEVAHRLHRIDACARFGFWFMHAAMHNHQLILSAKNGFARKLFYHHDEIEYGVPLERYRACLAEVRQYLLSKNYFAIIEVRFAPNRTAGLLSPGAGRRTCYIELAPALSHDTTAIFTEAEKIFQKYDGHVHLGKWTMATSTELSRMYGERYNRFLRVRQAADPDNKFINAFTARLFVDGPAAQIGGSQTITLKKSAKRVSLRAL